jgi:GxxExxY protein
VQREVPVPVIYEGIRIECGFRLDLLVNDLVIVETKAVAEIHPVFEAQLITHLKLMHKKLGFLINFNTKFLKDGIRRRVV